MDQHRKQSSSDVANVVTLVLFPRGIWMVMEMVGCGGDNKIEPVYAVNATDASRSREQAAVASVSCKRRH